MDELAKIIHDIIENDDDSGGGAYARAAKAVRSYLLSEERVEAAAKMMWYSETVGGSWEEVGEWEKGSYRMSARAAITAAIGEWK